MNKKRPSFEKFKKKTLQDKKFKAAYDLLESEFAFLNTLIKARKKTHRSQLKLTKHFLHKQSGNAL